MQTLSAAWQRWKVIARKIGDFQARVLLSVFYFGILGPFAVALQLFADPLGLSERVGQWRARPDWGGDSRAVARRQF